MTAAMLPKRLEKWLPLLRAAELCYGVDHLLLAALIDRESLGGDALEPKGAAGTGDGGHGRGLGQIDDRWHPTLAAAVLCSGRPLLEDPAMNILIAAEFLAHLIRLFDGSVEWPELPALASYNCGPKRVRDALHKATHPLERKELIELVDQFTTGKNYVADVMRRRAGFVVRGNGNTHHGQKG